MSTYRLDKLLAPRSVAVVGGSPRGNSVGRVILEKLRGAGFAGQIGLVSSRYQEIEGIAAVKSLRALPAVPDVVVITVPPPAVPAIIAEAADIGIAAAIVITAGLGHGPGSLAEACETASRKSGLRLVGPNCLGVMVPAAKFNATFAAHMPTVGNLAVISQSGAIMAGMVEWAAQRNIGFSAVVSIGDQLDVDFGDLLDHFALDKHTRAILLYIESIKDARKFMSAARAAARSKPVVVIKAGRHVQAARAAATHTGALAGSDAVYQAAFRRAGLLRVLDLGELFDAAETIGRIKSVTGNRLAILTNGGGIGVLAIDRLIDLGGTPAELSADTWRRLDAVLPATWSKANPVDIIGDADADRYTAALEALVADSQNDAVLAMNVETALAPARGSAAALCKYVESQRLRRPNPKPILASWVGAGTDVSDVFNRTGIAHYATESDAVRGFTHLVRHREAIDALMKTPPSLARNFVPDLALARDIVERVLAEGRTWLDPIECADLFKAYGIPIVPTMLARTPEEAAELAAPLLARGDTIAIKILSRDIIHKSDVGGVRLQVVSGPAVYKAAEEIIAKARSARPEARIAGVTIQPMIVRPKARELIAGLADDPTFGPVVVFGHGGTAVEVINDKALALVPLDLNLAHDLIQQTRVAGLLLAYRDVPEARVDDVALVLVKLAQLSVDLPEVRELDVNPLLADGSGVLALDARVAVSNKSQKFGGRRHSRFAVRPYPSEWERTLALSDDWRIFVRPVRPEDESLVRSFFEKVSPDDLRLRFFAPVKELGHVFIARLTQIDYGRAIAFVAIDQTSGEMVGDVRLHADANYETGEYAILLRSDVKGRGLGWKLMEIMMEYARMEGLKRIEGQVLRENIVMVRMCRELGFNVEDDPTEPNICIVRMSLVAPA